MHRLERRYINREMRKRKDINRTEIKKIKIVTIIEKLIF